MTFNATKVKQDLVSWLQSMFAANGPDCKAVIGISGGKDSTIAAALCVEALGKGRVFGVLMPNGIQHDIEDARAVVEHLGIGHCEINIKTAYDYIVSEIEKNTEVSSQTKINLAPRLRMSTLYAVSQSLNGRVINTSNLSEIWVGYSTRYGDSVGDFSPFAQLTVSELKQLGHTLDLPPYLVDKTPEDGLSGKSDEEKMGFSYNILDNYIRTGQCSDRQAKECIDARHKQNEFKRLPMPFFPYNGDL